ncbi:hypothetical protein C8J36_12314 [Rhizobium sp. PP-F2F-G48]|uniref:hypothetical protein n=1 Tax=Rhizobium sp. PP-F2F-G48 TaxID=2135651 RepID=UPI001045D2B6|nr:hypothetical protein [Rhizobium sp. PP-F2F-G48]TCM44842.1 hypothetical protein C8J36_12314 [Rhizobium sp. PP-F2F-G48]
MSISVLNPIYDKLKAVLQEAQNQQDDTIARKQALALGLREIEPISPKMMSAYAIDAGNDRMILEYRFYDASGPFSLAPDVNIYSLKLIRDEIVLAEIETRFSDKSIYG